MSIYEVSCWKSRKTSVKKGDSVQVIGKQSVLIETNVKADTIINLTQNGPSCACGEPDGPFDTKLWTRTFDKKGTVISVTETKDGFHFKMKSV